MQTKKARFFTMAHVIAKKTASIVGDYQIAFSLALQDLYAKRVKYTVVKKAAEEPGFDRSRDMVWALVKMECGAHVILLRGYADGCTEFKHKNMVTMHIIPVSAKTITSPKKYDSSAKSFVFSHAKQILQAEKMNG